MKAPMMAEVGVPDIAPVALLRVSPVGSAGFIEYVTVFLNFFAVNAAPFITVPLTPVIVLEEGVRVGVPWMTVKSEVAE
jgi:hypothetical protein